MGDAGRRQPGRVHDAPRRAAWCGRRTAAAWPSTWSPRRAEPRHRQRHHPVARRAARAATSGQRRAPARLQRRLVRRRGQRSARGSRHEKLPTPPPPTRSARRSTAERPPNLDPTDVADEQAHKYGAQFASATTTLSGIYQNVVRYVPAALQSQNEPPATGSGSRSRSSSTATTTSSSAGRAHPSPGDTGHTIRPAAPTRTTGRTSPSRWSNGRPPLLGVARLRHDAQRPDAHYDLGAGGAAGMTTVTTAASSRRSIRPSPRRAPAERGRTASRAAAAGLLGRPQPEVCARRARRRSPGKGPRW